MIYPIPLTTASGFIQILCVCSYTCYYYSMIVHFLVMYDNISNLHLCVFILYVCWCEKFPTLSADSRKSKFTYFVVFRMPQHLCSLSEWVWNVGVCSTNSSSPTSRYVCVVSLHSHGLNINTECIVFILMWDALAFPACSMYIYSTFICQMEWYFTLCPYE